MAVHDEINGLRRLMESINKLSASNAQSVGKLTEEVKALRAELQTAKVLAERAIQMCNDLAAKLKNTNA